MKLVYVTSRAPFTNREAFLLPEIDELRRQGAEVTVVPLRPGGPIVHGDPEKFLPISERQNLISPSILMSGFIQFMGRPLRVLAALFSLARSRSPRIALKNLAVFPKGLWLSNLALRKKADHIHAQWGGCSSTMALIAGKVSEIPWSMTLHRWDIPENNLLKQKVSSAAFARVIDENGLSELLGIPGVNGRKIVVLHVGVELPALQTIRRCPGGEFRLLLPAFFTLKKGHRYLLQALSILRAQGREVRLDLAGDGPLSAQIRRQVEMQGLSRQVTFLGAVSHPALLDGLARGLWSALVLPSITDGTDKEGIPVSLMEAMARCVPVISTLTGGISELLRDGAGILVPERDAKALADAIERLIEDKSLCNVLAQRGRKRIAESFAVNRVVADLMRLLQEGNLPLKIASSFPPALTAQRPQGRFREGY